MRSKSLLVSESSLMFSIGGQLFDQAPNSEPRKAEIIMKSVRDSFRNDERCFNDNEFYSMRLPADEIYPFVDSLLKNIPEFLELNLSYNEYQAKVDVNDPNRPSFALTSIYDKYDEESWKSDFIDLDAFVRNAVGNLVDRIDSSADCFLCKHQPVDSESTLDSGDDEKCKTCVLNSKLKNHYETYRVPRGKYTFACKYDCWRHRYICCEECDDKNDCKFKCDSSSSECGLKMGEVENVQR